MTRAQFTTLINTLGTGDKNTAAEVRAVFNAFKDAVVLTGDVKEIDCDNTYLALNFDGTGLGINERAGWAVCNGLNGTKDRNGKTSIAYGTSYPTLGATGGSKDAVVVEHSHNIATAPTDSVGYVTLKASSSTGGTPIATETVGVDGTNKNMQPYIVSLFIQKL